MAKIKVCNVCNEPVRDYCYVDYISVAMSKVGPHNTTMKLFLKGSTDDDEPAFFCEECQKEIGGRMSRHIKEILPRAAGKKEANDGKKNNL